MPEFAKYMTLSLLVPVYNELDGIEAVVELVSAALPGINKELILVDDGSKDGRPVLERLPPGRMRSACSCYEGCRATVFSG